MNKYLIALVAQIIISAGAIAGLQEPSNSVQDVPDDDMVLFRYDANRTGSAPFASNITEPQVRWIYSTGGDILSSPLIADVNGDDRYEVIVADDTGGVYVIDENGILQYGTSFGPELPMMPAAADIDGDGELEIIAGQGTHGYGGSLDIYALNGEDLSLIWSHTSTSVSEHGFFASPIFHDSDGDGFLDVLVGSMDDYFYAFNGLDGTIIWVSPQSPHYVRTTSPMNDIDNDGYQEVVGLDNSGLLRLYDADSGSIDWQVDLGYGVGSSPVIADFDGDGLGEIACFMILSGGVSAVNHDGSILWNDDSKSGSYTTPTIADVNGDDLPDLIGGHFWDHSVFALRGLDGSLIWETALPGITKAQSSLVSSDIDGDGEIEILAMGRENGLFSLDAQTGAIQWTFNIKRPFGQPTVWDLDQDGVAEIVVSAGDGLVYVLEQSPPPRFAPRTIGYWKHQCNVEEPKKDHPGISEDFVSAIAADSLVFSYIQSKDDVCDILWSKPKSDMMGKALKQLMALWLNVVSGYVDKSAEIDLPDLTSATTVGEAISEIEDILLNSDDKAELERAKDIADTLNNGVRS